MAAFLLYISSWPPPLAAQIAPQRAQVIHSPSPRPIYPPNTPRNDCVLPSLPVALQRCHASLMSLHVTQKGVDAEGSPQLTEAPAGSPKYLPSEKLPNLPPPEPQSLLIATHRNMKCFPQNEPPAAPAKKDTCFSPSTETAHREDDQRDRKGHV